MRKLIYAILAAIIILALMRACVPTVDDSTAALESSQPVAVTTTYACRHQLS